MCVGNETEKKIREGNTKINMIVAAKKAKYMRGEKNYMNNSASKLNN